MPRRRLYRVIVQPHRVRRWDVPARSTVIGDYTAKAARLQVLRWAHADAGVPPMKHLLRESWSHTACAEYTEGKKR